MLTHLVAILGLVGLCAGWVLFQQWLRRLGPGPDESDSCSGCGGCGCAPRVPEDTSGKQAERLGSEPC